MNETKKKKEFFFFRAGSVFELICKCVLMILVIPYGTLLLTSLLLDRILNVVAASNVWPIVIFFAVALLNLAGLVLSVIAVIRFCKRKIRQGETHKC